MGKLVVTEFVWLDGVMQAPGGEEFKYPGWSFEFDRGDDGNQFKLDETMESDVLLIGRVTYESFAGAWPDREGEFADKFNTMPKYVVSSTLEDSEWNNTTVLKGSATEEASKLKEEIDGIIQVPGSLRLVQELLEHDLVDELHLMVFPARARHRTAPVRRDERQDRLAANRVEAGRPGRRSGPDLPASTVVGIRHAQSLCEPDCVRSTASRAIPPASSGSRRVRTDRRRESSTRRTSRPGRAAPRPRSRNGNAGLPKP